LGAARPDATEDVPPLALLDEGVGRSAALERDVPAQDGSASGGSRLVVRALSAAPYKPDGAPFAAQSCAVPVWWDAAVQLAASARTPAQSVARTWLPEQKAALTPEAAEAFDSYLAERGAA
jgi:hypothetical protein